MTDREDAIKRIERVIQMTHKDSLTVTIPKYTAELVVAMLKEQKEVEPMLNQDEKGIFTWCCGSCGAYMYHIYEGIDKAKEYAKFCRKCGQAVKWE